MISDFKNHKASYVLLIVVLFLFVVAFLHFWPNRVYQRFLTIGMSVFYFIWGVTVHTKLKHINNKVILEYLAVSILAGSILVLLTF